MATGSKRQCGANQKEQSTACKEQDFDDVGAASIAGAEERHPSGKYQCSNCAQDPARCFAKATFCNCGGGGGSEQGLNGRLACPASACSRRWPAGR